MSGYEVEIVIRRRSATPFRVSGVQSDTRAAEIVESFLAAWGIPIPRDLRDTGQPAFTDTLAETGEYRDDAEDYRVVVKRTGPTTPITETSSDV